MKDGDSQKAFDWAPRQSVTHAHWILGSPRKTNMPKRLSSLEFLARMSCKSFLKLLGIISPGALFRESGLYTKSPLSNGSTAGEIDLEHCSKTSRLNPCPSVPQVEFLKQAKGLGKATGRFIRGCVGL